MQGVVRSEKTIQADSVGQVVHIVQAKPEGGNRGTVLLLHGLGDHIGRFDWAISLLCAAGYSVVGVDWPGNGNSEGIRGDMPTITKGGELIEEVLAVTGCKLIGLLAHSTGAFIAIKLLGSKLKAFEQLDWVWLNAPLIYPQHGQAPVKVILAKLLAKIAPGMTMRTGVKPQDCYDDKQEFPEGVHNRFSVRFGMELLSASREPEVLSGAIATDAHILVVQGDLDSVCPPPYSCRFFNSLAVREKTMLHVSGARHEPLGHSDARSIMGAIRAWLCHQAKKSPMTSD